MPYVIGFIKGDTGSNNYGPDPFAPGVIKATLEGRPIAWTKPQPNYTQAQCYAPQQPQPGFAPQAQGAQPQAQGAQAQPSAQSQDYVPPQQLDATAETQAPESNASNGSKPQ